MYYVYGAVITAVAMVFLARSIDELGRHKLASILYGLFAGTMFLVLLVAGVKTEVVDNGTVFEFKSLALFIFYGVMAPTSFVIAGLNYFYTFTEVE